MKYPRPFVLLTAALCGIVMLSQTLGNASASPPPDQRSARRNFLQSTFNVTANFELFVPQGQVINHYYRDNIWWTGWYEATDKLSYPCSPPVICGTPRSITVIQSNFKGSHGFRHFEAIVRVTPHLPLEGDRLDFWHFDTDLAQWQGPFPIIADGKEVTGVTGDPVLIQSTWGNQGNFEVYVPKGNMIKHYWRNNDIPPFLWQEGVDNFAYSCPPKPCYTPRGLSLIQSNYRSDHKHGNFEAVVRVAGLAGEPDHLDFWFRDSLTLTWHGPFPIVADSQLVTNVTGDPVLIQALWHPGGNFDVYVPQGDVIKHYYRDNDNSQLPWHIGTDSLSYACPQTPCPTPRGLTFIQSNFLGNGVDGNFEAVVQVASPLSTAPDYLDSWYLSTATVTWSGPFTILVNGQPIEVPIGL